MWWWWWWWWCKQWTQQTCLKLGGYNKTKQERAFNTHSTKHAALQNPWLRQRLTQDQPSTRGDTRTHTAETNYKQHLQRANENKHKSSENYLQLQFLTRPPNPPSRLHLPRPTLHAEHHGPAGKQTNQKGVRIKERKKVQSRDSTMSIAVQLREAYKIFFRAVSNDV